VKGINHFIAHGELKRIFGNKKFPDKNYFTSTKKQVMVPSRKASAVFDSKEFIYFFKKNNGHGHD
jgi:hypothetical protein